MTAQTTNAAADGNRQSMRPFFAIWTGQVFSLLGSELVQFTLVWWLTETTGSAAVLAIASMMAVLPRIFVSPIAGALVDRWDRRTLMIIVDGLIAFSVVVLALLFALDAVKTWHIFFLMFVRAVGGAFHWPAMMASTTLMVPETQLSRVAGLNQTVQGVANIAVPPLGALMLALLPLQAILAIDVVTALIAITPLLFIAIPQPRRAVAPEANADNAREEPPQTSILQDFREGLSFVCSWPGLLIILAIAAIANLMANPAFAVVPLLVSGHFGGGALELGWLQSVFGIGIVLGGLGLSIWGGFKRRIVTAYVAQVLGGLCFVAMGLAPENAFALAVGAAFCLGFLNPILNGSSMAALQARIPPQMQGRVFTLFMSVTGVTTPIGLAIVGLVGDKFGVQPWFLISGIVTAISGLCAFLIPAVMNFENVNASTAETAVPVSA